MFKNVHLLALTQIIIAIQTGPQYRNDEGDLFRFTPKGISLVPIKGRYLYTLGTRVISFYDIKMLNEHYKCSANDLKPVVPLKRLHASTEVTRTHRTALPAFVRLATAVGYVANEYVSGRPAGCGEYLYAAAKWQTKTYSFGDTISNELREDETTCNHWIKAPKGRKVQINVTAMRNVPCGLGCKPSSIEPKVFANAAITNPRPRGYRGCYVPSNSASGVRRTLLPGEQKVRVRVPPGAKVLIATKHPVTTDLCICWPPQVIVKAEYAIRSS
ncbi:unnamed protein product [Heligmosomoides polygyrus]|uniref:Astacin domain-containing protein n=1 Tax=Heligmosomoides polygyrus TaxID=6339 RepID=A0A3P7X6R2_HELPZ|nr:unnamed protein product [Heligmosomoides polygyrus]